MIYLRYLCRGMYALICTTDVQLEGQMGRYADGWRDLKVNVWMIR